jgi:hypothetical protein
MNPLQNFNSLRPELMLGARGWDNDNMTAYLGGAEPLNLKFNEKIQYGTNNNILINMYTYEDPELETERDIAEIYLPKGEHTPVQYFTSDRVNLSVFKKGQMVILAVDPDGNFYEGYFDSEKDSPKWLMYSKGCTICCISLGGPDGYAIFDEECAPAFIAEKGDIPLGEEGFAELHPRFKGHPQGDAFPQQFWTRFDHWTRNIYRELPPLQRGR